jgi:flavin reductase (DIM6/NTAB) family NADH-FMN oxidoreductase RutF
MSKQIWKPSTLLNPVPVVMVTCVDKDGKPNIITLAWSGTVNSEPPMLSISVQKKTVFSQPHKGERAICSKSDYRKACICNGFLWS